MLEKINKIQELLNIPNVDANSETALANMKILNLLVSLRSDIEQLNLGSVMPCFNYNDFESAFLAGYKTRAEMSDLTHDFASELHAKSRFIKWHTKRINRKA